MTLFEVIPHDQIQSGHGTTIQYMLEEPEDSRKYFAFYEKPEMVLNC